MSINLIKAIPGTEITDEEIFVNRRAFIKSMGVGVGIVSSLSPFKSLFASDKEPKLLESTPLKLIENYNNYYEFSFKKEDVNTLAQSLRIDPWSVEISGEVEKPTVFHLEDLLKRFPAQERLYRFRCVEGWSMVVPWQGFPLADLLQAVKPLSTAHFVRLVSTSQPEAMPNLSKNAMLQWPYEEGLRMDEAMHPLTLLASGMYGKSLAKQNGAPLRLVVPWKYGFKSIKAIVKIELLKRAPLTTWNRFAPNEYGFYANVNPAVPHPRWSQNSERLLSNELWTPRRTTELFNGYAEQVAHLYSAMDLRHFF
ncbi:protein-methionine-sulfoxide reductase catalytic subunit MsrP [Methylomonas sp. AM2-LC]|uniref:protein-methionine-sulfoxide reductase catalytic subunit MsrP n=1 Tax=Methylomonas sp. AM2-LC TaxID=3153301 RepID=UPI003267B15C